MKLVTWNCNGALRNKLKDVDSLDADILLIQECENPEMATKHYGEWVGDYLWVGTDKNKGICVFPKKRKSGFCFELARPICNRWIEAASSGTFMVYV